SDTATEFDMVAELCNRLGVAAVRCTHFAEGGKGAVDLAEKVVLLAENATSQFTLLYPDDMPLWDKARTIARSIYGADDIVADKAVRDQFSVLQNEGYGSYPICFAKDRKS